MVSRTKTNFSTEQLTALFRQAGYASIENIEPLGAGEFNAVYGAVADGLECAIKIAPDAAVPVMAHEQGMMAAELYWYDQIRQHTDIRVPKVYYEDFSQKMIPANYFIMEKLPGTQMDKMRFSPQEKQDADAQLARMAAQIHRIRGDGFGYKQCAPQPDWYHAIREMTCMALRDGERAGRKSERGQLLLRHIDRVQDILAAAESCMVNFDLYPPNILCIRTDGAVEYAWLDPERSFWGDRIADFVCLEMLKPLTEKKTSFAAYNAVAEQPVAENRETSIRYAVALGYLALVMETEKYYRYAPRYFGWWRNTLASGMLYKQTFDILGKKA